MSIIFSIILLMLYFTPFIILKSNSYFTIHDNLDSEFVFLHILKISHQAFNLSTGAMIENVMNGIPRIAFKSAFNITVILFYFFESHVAYIINYMLVHSIGFLGMYMLLKKHFIKEAELQYIVVLCSLAFALIPFYSIFGITVSGQPLLIFAFLNLLKDVKAKFWNYIIIIFFPLYALNYFIAPFIICFLSLILVVDLYFKKKINKKFLFGIALFCITVFIVDIQLIYSIIFSKNFVSHRSEFNYIPLIGVQVNLKWFLNQSLSLFFNNHEHTGSFSTTQIFRTLILALSIAFMLKANIRLILLFLFLILAICIFYPLYYYLIIWLGNDFFLFKIFQGNRFYHLLPFCWIILFAISLKIIAKQKILNPLVILLVLGQLFIELKSDKELSNNIKLLKGNKIDEPTYSEFFSPSLFHEIQQYIGKPQKDYKVVSIGMFPNVPQFNGFYTLDSYQNNYSLSYKHQFRYVIMKELAKNKCLQEYYDYWGCRCYIFSSELGKLSRSFMFGKNDKRVINNIEINTDKLKQMKGEYVLSALKINNYKENKLRLERIFNNKNSYWKIYLYKII
ncbi:MAG: DUF6044 family protein [Bacteroidota bacterium]|nr:DUF6044 family protein [Bacteroidota bacterium]